MMDTYGDMLRLMRQPEREAFEGLSTERRLRVYSRFRAGAGTPLLLVTLEELKDLPEKEQKRWLFDLWQRKHGL